MIRRFIVIVLAVMSLRVANAEYDPPVEVHIKVGDVLTMYDCYPLDQSKVGDTYMIVYLDYPEGIAGYLCEYEGGAWIMPFIQPGQVHVERIQGE